MNGINNLKPAFGISAAKTLHGPADFVVREARQLVIAAKKEKIPFDIVSLGGEKAKDSSRHSFLNLSFITGPMAKKNKENIQEFIIDKRKLTKTAIINGVLSTFKYKSN